MHVWARRVVKFFWCILHTLPVILPIFVKTQLHLAEIWRVISCLHVYTCSVCPRAHACQQTFLSTRQTNIYFCRSFREDLTSFSWDIEVCYQVTLSVTDIIRQTDATQIQYRWHWDPISCGGSPLVWSTSLVPLSKFAVLWRSNHFKSWYLIIMMCHTTQTGNMLKDNN